MATTKVTTAKGVNRRQLLQAGIAGTAGIALSGCATRAIAATARGPVRTLIRNVTIASGDATVGNLQVGEILIEGERIAAIAPTVMADDAMIVDASGMLAIPGMIDTHRHMWQGAIRRSFPDVTLGEYFGGALATMGPLYRAEDVYYGNLISALSAIDAGITNILDWSHIQNTPAHTDAAIAALTASGIRAVFGYGTPQVGFGTLADDPNHRYPQDILRLRREFFASEDQLLTLALCPDGPSFGPAEPAIAEWHAAREAQARISVHIMGPQTLNNLQIMNDQGLLRDDTTYVHCTSLPDEAWRLIKDTGGTVSISATVEMQMGHGMPAVQASLDHGIRPSLSVDVETSAPNDMFTQMRSVLSLQRALIHARQEAGEENLPPFLTTKDVFEFATIDGARANGLANKTGSLAPGKQADIVLLRQDSLNVLPVPANDPIASLVLGMDTSNVDSVFVAGRALKRDGHLVGIDMAALLASARASQEYLMESAARIASQG